MPRIIGFPACLFLLFTIAVSAANKPLAKDVFYYSEFGCLGSCPVYRIYIFPDGAYLFDGLDHVKYKGIYTGSLSPDVFRKIVNTMKDYDIQGFRDGYPDIWNHRYDDCKNLAMDAPSSEMRFQYHGESKYLYHNYGCTGFPREKDLNDLERKIKNIIDIQYFISR
ncbi:MAG: DUF6438 domain-containing protein [Gammaproteobacteria bacterium]